MNSQDLYHHDYDDRETHKTQEVAQIGSLLKGKGML